MVSRVDLVFALDKDGITGLLCGGMMMWLLWCLVRNSSNFTSPLRSIQ